MKEKIYHTYNKVQKWRKYLPILFTLSLFHLFTFPASAQIDYSYTKENPVIIASDWDFPPYEYSNDQGEPAGYNVELLQTIFKKLDIPYRIILREWSEAAQTFERRDADLVIDPSYRFHGRPYIRSTNILNYYKVQIVSSAGARKVTALADFTPEDTLVLKLDDYAANRIVDERHLDVPIIYCSPKEALAGISEGRYNYFIWGEGPLNWKKKELAIDTLITGSIDIPDGEIRIVGYDKELIDAIDDEYARLEQGGDLEKLRDKWFHPERQHDDTSPVALIVLAGAIVAVIIGLLMARLVRDRVRQAVRRSEDLNQIMEQALNMGKYYVFTIDVVTGQIHNIHGDLLPEGELVREVFLPRIDKSDQEEFQKKVDLLISGELQQARYTKRLNIGSLKDPNRIWLSGLASLEYVDFKPRYITNTARDITQQIEDERINSELSAKYMKIFETNIIAMAFYDSEGNLIDMNDNMRKLCEVNEASEAWLFKTKIFDTALVKDQYLCGSREEFHVCQHAVFPQLGIDKYIELRLKPVCDDHDKVKYYVSTAREITDERNIYLEQLHHNKEMEKTNAAINEYESRLQYLLDNSQMFIWNYYPESGQITYTHSSRKNEFSETLEEFFEGVDEESMEQALTDIKACIESRQPYDAIHHYRYTPLEKHPVWYAISGIPNLDKAGKLTSYFGIARNITFLMDAQERRLPGQHDPRDTHAAQRHRGLLRPVARHRHQGGAYGVHPQHPQQLRHAHATHQRHPRSLVHGSGTGHQARRVRRLVRLRRHLPDARPARARAGRGVHQGQPLPHMPHRARQGPCAAGAHQFRHQRRQIHPSGFHQGGLPLGASCEVRRQRRGRRTDLLLPRHWRRHPQGQAGERLRALRQTERLRAGYRPRTLHLPEHRRALQRPHRRYLRRRGTRLYLLVLDPLRAQDHQPPGLRHTNIKGLKLSVSSLQSQSLKP